VTKKKLSAGFGGALETVQTYDNEGKVQTVKYPDYYNSGTPTLITGPTYTYSFDSAGRPNGLTDNSAVTWVQGVSYSAAGQMTSLQYRNGASFWREDRTYNDRLQMTRLQVWDNYPNLQNDWEYRYSPSANNGRIEQMKDGMSGEEVNYQYDSLQRLINSETTGTEWGLSFGFDGWGNRTSQSVTKGSGPTSSLSFNGLTNRVATAGFGYDSNGNMTTMPGAAGLTYDSENRLLTANAEQYWYGPDNKRVWLKKSGGEEQFFFYGIGGRRMGVYRKFTYLGSPYLTLVRDELYFAGKRIRSGGVAVAEDRLGSTRKGDGVASRFYPYGEEFGTATAQDRTKFATYYRDAGTLLDYADQRYYDRLSGRFLTIDRAAPEAESPSSFNQYAYAADDPTNFNDPDGLAPANVSLGDGFGCAPSGAYMPGGSIDASNPCPPGFTIAWGGHGATKSRTQQVFEIFSPLSGIIEDWDYANASGTAFNITISGEMFNDFAESGTLVMQAPGVWKLGGVLITVNVVELLPLLTNPVTLTVVGIGAAATIGYLIYSKGGDQNVGDESLWLEALAESPKDPCTWLKNLEKDARRKGDSKLFNAAKRTWKYYCRGK
jgi:RHS repeat-associated protein